RSSSRGPGRRRAPRLSVAVSRRERRAARRARAPVAEPAAAVAAPPPDRTPWTRRDTALALACAAVPLAAYLATLSPTVNGGDSGEMIAVAAVTGVAHPPGVPLHTPLAKLFTLLPSGRLPARVNPPSPLC